MEIEKERIRMEKLQSYILEFIDDDNDEESLHSLHNFLKEEKNLECPFKLLIQIIEYHHRKPNFFSKITAILDSFKFDVRNFFTSNYFIDLYLVKNKLIRINKKDFPYYYLYKTYEDRNVTNKLVNPYFLVLLYYYYKSVNNEGKQKEIEAASMKIYNIDFQKLENLCQIGENDSEICTLIRSDSIIDFITYHNKNNINLNNKIPFSLFETNRLLLYLYPTIIEYTAFCGSVQIFKYLLNNKVELTSDLLNYAVHGRNSEIIHIIEEKLDEIEAKRPKYFAKTPFSFTQLINLIKGDDMDSNCPLIALLTSIQLLHNDIAKYFEQNYFDENDKKIKELIGNVALHNNNYELMPTDFSILINKNRIFHNHLLECVTKITLPSSVTEELTNNMFSSFINLKEIVIPDSIISIGKLTTQKSRKNDYESYFIGAFKNCKKLAQVSFITPSSLALIGEMTFADCSSLVQIKIPSSVKSIGESVFSKCSSLEQIEIPSSVTSIGDYCFYKCTSLTQVSISSSITSIGKRVFFKCTSLKEIVIPSSTKSIDNEAFKDCSSLKNVKFSVPSSLLSIGESAFNLCSSLEQIEIPSSVTSICKSAFSECKSLKKIIIPSFLTLIDDYTFYNCTSLEQITIPSSVTIIGAYSFNNCSSITQITIPSSVTVIKNGAFKGCSSLPQITIPSSLASIENEIFKDCSSLTKISIPSSISKIGDFSFYNCKSLKQIQAHSSVTEIGSFSFYGCSTLTNITNLSNLTKIGDSAFDGCPLLTTIPSLTGSENDQNNKDDIQKYIQNWKEIHKDLLYYFKSSDMISINDKLKEKIQKISENEYELIEFLNLLSRITEYPNPFYINLFDKTKVILDICKEKMKQKLTDSKIFQIFKNNERNILILIENKTFEFTRSLYYNIKNSDMNKKYFKPEKMKMKCQSEETRNQHLSKFPKDFESKRKEGENEDEIIQLIKKDLLDEYIQYESQNNDKISTRSFETHPILRFASYIGYAAFYGATKIFDYLLKEKYDDNKNLSYLWEFAIYGKQIDIIHMLEKNCIKLEEKEEEENDPNLRFFSINRKIIDAEYCLTSAIKGHNNEIVRYIIQTFDLKNDLLQPSLEFSNFTFINFQNIKDEELLYYLCLYDYPNFAQVLIDTKKIDVDSLPNKNEIIKASILANNSIFTNLYKMVKNISFTKEDLIHAIKSNNIEVFKIIISHLKDEILFNTIGRNLEIPIYNEKSPFNLAILMQNHEMVEILLKRAKNNDVNCVLEYYEGIEHPTALHLAIYLENVHIVKLLLSHPGIDVNCYAKFDNIAVYKMKNMNNCSYNDYDNFDLYCTPLHEAVEIGNVEIAKMLLAHPDIQVNKIEGYDSYHRKYESFDRVKLTALCIAVLKNNYEMTKILLNHQDIDVNLKSVFLQNCQNDEDFNDPDYDEDDEFVYNYDDDTYIDINEIDLNDIETVENKENKENKNDDENDIFDIDSLFGYDVSVENIHAKRSALQFAYKNESRDIIQLLLSRKDLKNTRVKKNDFIIERFY